MMPLNPRQLLGTLILAWFTMLLGTLPAMAQAFPSTALTADGTEFLQSDMTTPYLSMSSSLLAAAEVPSGASGRYTMAQAQGGAGGAPTGGPSLENMSKEMDNPLGKLWIIFMQNDTSLYDGRPLGEEIINTTTILPVLSFPLGKAMTFAVRPIIPFLAAPKPQVPGGFGQFPDEFNSDTAAGAFRAHGAGVRNRRYQIDDPVWPRGPGGRQDRLWSGADLFIPDGHGQLFWFRKGLDRAGCHRDLPGQQVEVRLDRAALVVGGRGR